MNQSRRELDKTPLLMENVMNSALTCTVTHGSNVWLVDSGASKHMTGFKHSFTHMTEEDSPQKVKLGDDYQYPIKGSGEASYKLDSGKSMKMKDVLYVLGLKKNSPLHLSFRCQRISSCIC